MSLVPERIVADVDLAALFGQGAQPFSTRNLGDLLPGRAYSRTPPVYLDRADVGHDMARIIDDMFGALEEPPLALPLLEIAEALVFGQGSVVLPDSRLLHESAREFLTRGVAPEGSSISGSGWVLPIRPVERILGRTLLVKRPWYRNYGHWLVDLMPIIPLVTRNGLRPDTIVFGEPPEGSVRTIMADVAAHFLPHADVVWMSDEAQLRCETLLYVRPTHEPPIFKHPLAMQLTVDAAHTISGGEPTAAPPKKLYVSRQQTSARRITNADEVEAVLAAHGFETLHAQDLGFAEQIAAFARAECVVGVKGAGLANVLFCRPGTELLVLSPANFPDPFFWDLATQRGLRYAEIFCAALASPTAPAGRSDFEVDVASLSRYLAGERHAPPPVAKRRLSRWPIFR